MTEDIILNGELEFSEIKPRAKRLNQSKTARTRRRKNKTIVSEVQERRYARNRRMRKNK